MKRTWKQPVAMAQIFMANEYVAACEPKIYTFECNTEWGNVYCNNPEDQALFESLIPVDYSNRGAGCGISHEYVEGDKLVPGWSDYNGNGTKDEGEDILIWFDKNAAGEYDFAGVHLTNNVNMDSWETNKS